MPPVIVPGIVTEVTLHGKLLAISPVSLITVPKVFAKVNSTKPPSRS